MRPGSAAASGLAVLLLSAGCGGSRTEVLRWQFVRAEGDGVTVDALHGACDDGPRALVREDGDRVEVTVRTRTQTGSCVAVGVVTPVTVRLQRPLGGRRLTGCAPQVPACRTYRL